MARFRAATSAGGSYHVVDTVVCEESAVIDTDINKQPLNRVTAIFADSSLSFVLPQGATLENIADCLDDFGVRRTLLSSNSLPQRCKSRAKIGYRFALGCWPNCPA